MSQRLLKHILGATCTLTLLPSPRQAIDLLKTGASFELLITDFLFPAENAIPLIQFARGVFDATRLPILVASSAMDDLLLNKVIKAGANEGVVKPLKGETLLPLVERLLRFPYVREDVPAVTEVTCMQWSNRGVAYEFCPELGTTLSAANREEAHQAMSALLHEHLIKGTPLGYIHSERVVSHMVRPRSGLSATFSAGERTI